MPKISQQNRKFFLKWLPFNFCDRHCERCLEFKNECAIYRDEIHFKMECLRKGKDPDDPKVVFAHIGKMMAQTMALVAKALEKEGIKLTQEDEDEYFKEEAKKEKIIRRNALYEKSWKTMDSIRKFLDEFAISVNIGNELIINSLTRYFEEINFYTYPIFIKTARALHSRADDIDERIKFPRPDWMVSGALSYYSLLTVRKSLENIRNMLSGSQDIWVLKINGILKDLDDIKKMHKKFFPNVDQYINKIIFHGDYKGKRFII
jgi:hypothetical protein